VLVTSAGILAALIALVASALGYLPGYAPETGEQVAEVLTLCSGILFVVAGTRAGRAFGVFTLLVVVPFAAVQFVAERAGDPWILGYGLVLFPLMAVLEILAPSAAIVCGLWGLYAVAAGVGAKGE
jgi:hypothetical protein